MGEASLFAFFTIHGRAPSSIKRDLAMVFPEIILLNISIIFQFPFQPAKHIIIVLLPCMAALDSHLAKFAIPRATCARTSG
jgi:hypothetical protein